MMSFVEDEVSLLKEKYLPDTPMTPYGRFINPQGYKAPWHHNVDSCFVFKKAIFEFTLDAQKPIIFEDGSFNLWQPDKHFFTDWGSIPVFLQWLIPKDAYLGYLFHDSGYGHHGLWLKEHKKEKFVFQELGREDVDLLLYNMMMAQEAWKITAETVYKGVRIGGSFAWNNHEKRRLAGSQKT